MRAVHGRRFSLFLSLFFHPFPFFPELREGYEDEAERRRVASRRGRSLF